jgi:hypothetical protein
LLFGTEKTLGLVLHNVNQKQSDVLISCRVGDQIAQRKSKAFGVAKVVDVCLDLQFVDLDGTVVPFHGLILELLFDPVHYFIFYRVVFYPKLTGGILGPLFWGLHVEIEGL